MVTGGDYILSVCEGGSISPTITNPKWTGLIVLLFNLIFYDEKKKFNGKY